MRKIVDFLHSIRWRTRQLQPLRYRVHFQHRKFIAFVKELQQHFALLEKCVGQVLQQVDDIIFVHLQKFNELTTHGQLQENQHFLQINFQIFLSLFEKLWRTIAQHLKIETILNISHQSS